MNAQTQVVIGEHVSSVPMVITNKGRRPARGAELMGWMFVDDNFLESPRLLDAARRIGQLGKERASSAWLTVLSYSRRHLVGGVLNESFVRELIRDRRVKIVVDALVGAKLWERVELNGEPAIRIRGYTDYYGDDEAARSELDRRRVGRRAKGRRKTSRAGSRAGSRAEPRAGSRDTDTDTDKRSPPNPPEGGRGGESTPAGDDLPRDPFDEAERLAGLR